MGRVVRRVVVVLVIVVVGAVAYGAWRNPEKRVIYAAARAGVPGQFVGSSQGVTHYEAGGPDTGRVVVLVHGFSVSMYIWDSTFAALSRSGYRVIRYDLFGRGWSDRPDAAYDGAMYDAQLDELLDSLHVMQPIDLVGLSFGGFVTAHYVAGHAARIRTFTLVDPSSSRATLSSWLKLPVIGPWIWQTTQVPNMPQGQPSDFLHPEHYPTWVDQYLPQMRFKGFGRATLRSLVTLSKTDFDSLFASAGRTGVPTLLIWGKQDPTVPIANAEVVQRNIPQLEYFPVDSSGHLPHIEQSAIVDAKLLSFFRSHAGVVER